MCRTKSEFGVTASADTARANRKLYVSAQTPGAPLLRIFLTTTNTAVVSWPSAATGWNLQESADLTTTNWTAPPEGITDDGTNKFILVNPPAGNRFYRLHKP